MENLSFEDCYQDENYKARLRCVHFITQYLNEQTQKKIMDRKIPAHIHAWFVKRGFDIKTILLQYSNRNFMFVSDSRELSEAVKRTCHNWEWSGLFNMMTGQLKYFSDDDYCVIFPISYPLHIENRFFTFKTSIRRRSILGSNPKDVELSKIEDCPSSFGFMGIDWACNRYATAMSKKALGLTVYLTEGAPDMLAGMEMFSHQEGHIVLSTGNTNNMDQIYNLELISGCSSLILCFDNDTHGIETRNKVAIAATRFDLKVKSLQLDEGCKDLNEVLQKRKKNHAK